MKSAKTMLTELARHVRPPRGCAIVVVEWKSSAPPEPNWLAACGIMRGQTLERYNEKVAELRKTDPTIDWSDVKFLDGLRRVSLWLSEVDES